MLQYVINVYGKSEREVALKVTFCNARDETVDVKVTVNGDDFNTVPFYITGKFDKNSADAMYIPILLSKEENTIVLSYEKEGLEIINAEAIVVSDLL